MKKWTLTSIAVSTFLSASLYSLPAHSASFDCNKASSTVEHLICANPELSQLDEDLALQYKAEMEDTKDNAYDSSEESRAKQIQWLVFQRNTCQDETCLIREYRERLGGTPKLGVAIDYLEDIAPANLPKTNAFGRFSTTTQISVYNPDAKNEYDVFNETNSIDILSVTKKPYLAVIDSTMIFSNAHMCSISDQLSQWSENHWTLTSYEFDDPAELRLYPAVYKGKSQVLVKDIDEQYRRLNCGMRGYFDGMLLEKE